MAALFNITPLHAKCYTMESTSKTFEDLLKAQKTDPLCSKLFADLNSDRGSPTNEPIRARYRIADNGALTWISKGLERVVVPPAFRRALISEAHESAMAGHHGIDKTYSALAEGYYWPRMFEDMHWFVTTRVSCQSNKPDNRAPAGQARPIKVTEIPFLEVSFDFTGPLSTSRQGNNTMLNVTDTLRGPYVVSTFLLDLPAFGMDPVYHKDSNGIWQFKGYSPRERLRDYSTADEAKEDPDGAIGVKHRIMSTGEIKYQTPGGELHD